MGQQKRLGSSPRKSYPFPCATLGFVFFFRKGFESKEDLVTSVSRIAEYTQTRLVWVAGAGVLREHMGEKEEPRELVGVTSGKVRAKESDQARSASGRSPRISSM